MPRVRLLIFLRFNVSYMTEIYRDQPYSSSVTWNLCEYRALEGVRVCSDAVQFYVHCGESAVQSGDYGECGYLETGVHCGVVRILYDAVV